jgi:hypothetical protein
MNIVSLYAGTFVVVTALYVTLAMRGPLRDAAKTEADPSFDTPAHSQQPGPFSSCYKTYGRTRAEFLKISPGQRNSAQIFHHILCCSVSRVG